MITKQEFLYFVDRASRYICVTKTNLTHYLSSVYFVKQPLNVTGIFVAHHQEVYCLYIYIYVYIYFMYHSRIVLSVGGSVRYLVRNLRCTVTIDSVLANSKTKNASLFTVHAIFRHDYPLAVEPASTPRPLVQKKL